MKFINHTKENGVIAELTSQIILTEMQDFLDLMANASYNGAQKIIIYKQHLHPDFFNLKTKMAGEVLQKFSTYRQNLAIVGDFSEYSSKSLKDFISESNRIKQILFVNSLAEGLEKL